MGRSPLAAAASRQLVIRGGKLHLGCGPTIPSYPPQRGVSSKMFVGPAAVAGSPSTKTQSLNVLVMCLEQLATDARFLLAESDIRR